MALGLSDHMVDHGWNWGFYVGLFPKEEVAIGSYTLKSEHLSLTFGEFQICLVRIKRMVIYGQTEKRLSDCKDKKSEKVF